MCAINIFCLVIEATASEIEHVHLRRITPLWAASIDDFMVPAVLMLMQFLSLLAAARSAAALRCAAGWGGSWSRTTIMVSKQRSGESTAALSLCTRVCACVC